MMLRVFWMIAMQLLWVNPLLAQSAAPRAVDLTDQARSFSAMVDVKGLLKEEFWFSLSKVCKVWVVAARGTGFTVRYRVLTIDGSVVLGSLMGTQTRPREAILPPGNYKFVIEARRNAGYYTFEVESNCSI